MPESTNFFGIQEERKKLRGEILEATGESARTLENQGIISESEVSENISGGNIASLDTDVTIVTDETKEKLEAVTRLNEQAKGFRSNNLEQRAIYEETRSKNIRSTRLSPEMGDASESENKRQGIFQELDTIERFFTKLKQGEYLALKHHDNPRLKEKLRQTAKIEKTLEGRLAYIEAHPELALYHREHDLSKYRVQMERQRFVVTESRRQYIDRIEVLINQGKPILLEGHTGTGKSELARIAAKELTGENPEVISCNPQTRQSDIFGRQSLKETEHGATVTEVDYGPLIRAMQDGRICLLDEFNELDPRQRQVFKYLFNAKPGDEVDVPGDGKIRIKDGFGIILTANLKSDKYAEKGSLEPQEARVFQDSTIRVEYAPAPELYDTALTALANTKGEVLLTEREAKEILKHFTDAVHDIQSAYTESIPAHYGKDDELSVGLRGSKKNKRPHLEKYVLDTGMAVRLLQGFHVARMKHGTPLWTFLDQSLARTLEGDRVSEDDKKLALFMLAKHGFLRDETLWQELKLDFSDGRLNPNIFPEQEETLLDGKESLKELSSEEVARLDPYQKRNISMENALEEFGVKQYEHLGIKEDRGGERQGEVSLTEADTLFRKNFFGPEAIRETFGFTLDAIPAIPFSKQELQRAEKEGALLILQIDKLADGTPLTGEVVHQRFGKQQDGNKFLYDTDWYKDEDFFIKESPRSGWRLVTPELLPNSTSKNYYDQTQLLVSEVEALDRGYVDDAVLEWSQKKDALKSLMDTDWKEASKQLAQLEINQLFRESFVEVMYRLKLVNQTWGKNLLPNKYTWTNSRTSDGDLVFVGFFGAGGARVDGDDPRDVNDNLGVSFSRGA